MADLRSGERSLPMAIAARAVVVPCAVTSNPESLFEATKVTRSVKSDRGVVFASSMAPGYVKSFVEHQSVPGH
jgi:hypothetical protein